MPPLGQHAIVVGAGIAGLVAGRVLADHYAQVTLLDRDSLEDSALPRPGVPQGAHLHALLAGGSMSLEFLLPGLQKDLEAHGAVPLVGGLDILVERAGRAPDARRDLGLRSFSLSRPLLELSIRRRACARRNLRIEGGVRVREIRIAANGCVEGVIASDGSLHPADLVIDASGRGDLTLRALETHGYPLPRTTAIGVDVHYATGVFAIPTDSRVDWKGVMTLPPAPHSTRGAIIAEMEGRRWMCGLGGRGSQAPPGDLVGFLAYLESLYSHTIFRAVRDAELVGAIRRFAFPESYQRHFEELERFPIGLLPVGDALCRFNPVYGQGMSVAAIQLRRLSELLEDAPPPAESLAKRFFEIAAEVRETPWSTSALPDLVFPQTTGERPSDLYPQLAYTAALHQLAQSDAQVHALLNSVLSLVTPRSALFKPELSARVRALARAPRELPMEPETLRSIDTELVRELICSQFPNWAHLKIEPVQPAGWDNRSFRLGTNLVVRLPSAARYSPQVDKEQRWLPHLAARLELPIPSPVERGAPGYGYPWSWSILRWIEGDTASLERISDPVRFARDLAGFLRNLHAIDASGGPRAGSHSFHRGGDLRVYDAETRRTLEERRGELDVEHAEQIWDLALGSQFESAPVWLHGDLAADNLLVRNGVLSGVIDFGCCAVGDPACDLTIAWTFLPDEARTAFREELALDPETWRRARGWALWKALITLDPTAAPSPTASERALRVIEELLGSPEV